MNDNPFTINPVDKTFPTYLKDLNRKVDNLNKSRQPFIGDWFKFNVADFTYVSNNVVQANSEFDISQFFQIGDKIWITQTTEKYFYVVNLDTSNNRIQLSAGDDFTFTNASFTLFAKSGLPKPQGHPLSFNFSASATIYAFVASWTNDTSRFGGGTGSISARFAMIGNLVILWYSLGTTDFRANVVAVNVSSPIPLTTTSVGNVTSTILTTGAIGGGSDIHVSTMFNPVEQGGMGAVILANRLLGTPFDTGSWGIDFTLIGIV